MLGWVTWGWLLLLVSCWVYLGMFSLLHGLWKYMFTKTELFTLIVGLDDAGKTTLLEQMKSLYQGKDPLPPSKITPTVGLNCTSLSQTYHLITTSTS